MYKNVMSYTDECCALKMPTNYVSMSTEDMEYVDGGYSEGYYRKQAQARWRAEWAKMTAKQRAAIEKKARTVGGGYFLAVLGGVTFFLNPVAGGIATGVISIASYVYTAYTA